MMPSMGSKVADVAHKVTAAGLFGVTCYLAGNVFNAAGKIINRRYNQPPISESTPVVDEKK